MLANLEPSLGSADAVGSLAHGRVSPDELWEDLEEEMSRRIFLHKHPMRLHGPNGSPTSQELVKLADAWRDPRCTADWHRGFGGTRVRVDGLATVTGRA